MRLDNAESNSKSRPLRLAAASMIASGYYGELVITGEGRKSELVVTGDTSPHWICWLVSMILASYIIYELLVGPASATAQDRGPFAMPGALSEGSSSISQPLLQVLSGSLISDETKHTIEASLAEDSAEGLALSAPEANAYELQSDGVGETLQKLPLRCRAHLCLPPQPRGDLISDVCAGEQNEQTRSLSSVANGLGRWLCRRSFTSGGDP